MGFEDTHFVHLTIWSWYLQTIYFVVALYFAFADDKKSTTPSWTPLRKASLLLFALGLPTALTVSTAYWVLLYRGGGVSVLNATHHGLNSVTWILELAVGRVRLHPAYLLPLFIFSVTYVLVNFIFVHYTRIVIYPVIPWDVDPSKNSMRIVIIVVSLNMFYACVISYFTSWRGRGDTQVLSSIGGGQVINVQNTSGRELVPVVKSADMELAGDV